ncbi:TPA: hypothetical protein DF272_01045 [Candidatus Falkowbacteria bacterium]|nr:hypothetical protein [Candidatus Falkowbacteria bacterium]
MPTRKKRVTVRCHSVLSVSRTECVAWDDIYIQFWHGDSYEQFCITVHDLEHLFFDNEINRKCFADAIREGKDYAKDFQAELSMALRWLKRHRAGEKFIFMGENSGTGYYYGDDHGDDDPLHIPDISIKTYELNRFAAEQAIEWYLRESMKFPYQEYFFAWVPSEDPIHNF